MRNSSEPNNQTQGTGAAGKSFLLALLGSTIVAGLGKMVLEKIKQDKRDKLAAQSDCHTGTTK
ncbi:hypothetical protein [Neomicrococcus lactis]|uniref:Uncharacterized protein n=1 Tax=Neomicrococcus lactis TaxID=732241 RepID=A0A7W8YBY4_9MICC|nr:hypothetical protein [Neomicrococcus lactis]MBB5598572.1 hypothetical protein [Neomicrococcus lactis]